MPASQAQEVRRGRLLQGFFWGGVGLATLAMLVLLFSQSVVVLRVAVILCVVAIMMLAISIVLRPSVEMIRVEIEEHVIGEVERVRLRARDDISTAARNTHRALSEKIHALTTTVTTLQAQIEQLRVSMLAASGPASHLGQPPPAAGVVHHTETVQVTRRTTTVDPGDDTRGTVYGSRSAMEGEWSEERSGDVGTRPRSPASPEPRDGYGEADWEATFRSLSRRPNALPASPGQPASWYTDDHDDEAWTRSRGRERESGHGRDREYGRHADRDQEYGRHADRDQDAEYGRHSERHRDRASDHDRDNGRDHGRDRPSGREGDHRDSAQDGYRDHDRYLDQGRDRDYDRYLGQGRDRDHDRYLGQGRDRDHDRYLGQGRDRDHDRYLGHERDQDHDRHERDRGRERDDRGYEREPDRGYGRPRERDHRYDGDRGNDGDRGYDGDGYGRSHDHSGDRGFPRPRSPHPAEREP